MADLKLNGARTDLEIVDDDFSMIEDGAEELSQRLELGLSIIQGELRFDPLYGIPWFAFAEVGVQESAIEAAVKRQILLTPGVERVDTLNVQRDRGARRLSLDYVVNGVAGQSRVG